MTIKDQKRFVAQLQANLVKEANMHRGHKNAFAAEACEVEANTLDHIMDSLTQLAKIKTSLKLTTGKS